jgi:hypothetical protein
MALIKDSSDIEIATVRAPGEKKQRQKRKTGAITEANIDAFRMATVECIKSVV